MALDNTQYKFAMNNNYSNLNNGCFALTDLEHTRLYPALIIHNINSL